MRPFLKRFVLNLLVGFVAAVVFVFVGFVAGGLSFRPDLRPLRIITEFIWGPASWLVALSNTLCPPFGVSCVFGSNSQGSHHLWFGTCLLGFWWILFATVSWAVSGARTIKRANFVG
jgi:hypothetical protein